MGSLSDVMIMEAREALEPDVRPCSVFVASGLRELYREARAGRGAAFVPAIVPVPDAVVEIEAAEPEPVAVERLEAGPDAEGAPDEAAVVEVSAEDARSDWDDAPLLDLRLRQDGKRPLCFRGVLIVAGVVETPVADGKSVRQSIALWGRADGGAVLSIGLEPPDASAMRPLHRLSVFPSAEALGSVLEAHDPSDAFVDFPYMPALALADVRRDAERLRRDFLELAGLALGRLSERP